MIRLRSQINSSLNSIAQRLALAASVVVTTGGIALAAPAGPMGVYDSAGESYFSLSVSPDVQASADAPRDVVVLFDTSASQTGMYRETALSALDACLANLKANDRVQIVAVDLQARPVSNGFAAAGSPAAAEAAKRLRNEAPLGSTDMQKALGATLNLLEGSTNDRVALYIGDGMSAANLLDDSQFSKLISQLREARIAVSSYAIGPDRDAHLLAAVANQTGGNLYVDQPMVWGDETAGVTIARAAAENNRRGAQVGQTLADWVHGTVVWPTQVTTSDSIQQLYPAKMPPLRTDRDSVIVGRLAPGAQLVDLRIEAKVAGQTTKLDWSRQAVASSDGNAYLKELVTEAAADNGIRLATVGTAGLVEAGRLINSNVDGLTDLAERAIASGDLKNAGRIAQAVLRRDPGNVRAITVQGVVSKGTDKNGLNLVRTAQVEVLDAPPAGPAFGDQVIQGAPVQGEMVQQDQFFDEAINDGSIVEGPVYEGPINQGPISQGPIVEGPTYIDGQDVSNYPPTSAVVDGRFLDSVERKNSLFAQMLEKEVRNIIIGARDIMSTSPDQAIQDLKLAMQSVQNAPELLADVRASLTDRLETALREASRSAFTKAELDREREEAQAAGRERRLFEDRLSQQREKEKQLMARFNSLMDERRYSEAIEVADIVEEVDPNGVTPRAARIWAEHRRQHELNQALRVAKAKNWMEALYQVELSSIPFPDEPPIVYPAADVWEELTNRRKKYQSVDLNGEGEAAQRINDALTSPLSSAGLEFTETPLEEVVEFLRDEYQVEIKLDTRALDDLGIGPDEPVTVNLRNISLRSALRLMLKELELTYIIADEVMLITTEEEAQTRLSVKVYPVGDLVIDKTPLVGGGGGGGLGGGGQQGGGGGLGGGGGGGGFGGGGGGGGGFGGGGGGQFAVPAETVSADSPNAANEASGDLVLTKRAAASTQAAPAQAAPAQAAPAQPVATKTIKTTTKATKALGKQAKLPAIVPDKSVSPEIFWQNFFQAERRDSAQVRLTARKLMKKGEYPQVIALVQSALRAGQPQSWMYEALGIAMQLSGQSPQHIERAIMSAVDFSRSPEELMLIAQYLLSLELDQRAIQVYQQITKLDPLRTEAYVLALRAAERSNDLAGIEWSTVGILSQAWPKEHRAIESTALRLAKATLRQLAESGDNNRHATYQTKLQEALVRDCVIRVSWTGDADVDLLVEEPGGTVCSLSQPRTTSGGVSLGDDFATFDNAKDELTSLGFTETYVCPKGFSGDYKLLVRRVWGDVTANKVKVDIYTNYRSGNVKHEQQQIDLGEGTAAARFELADGRRTQPLEQQQLAQAIQRQEIVGRAVLAQQLGSISDPRVTPIRPDDRIRRRQAFGGGGAVGFQPVIATLPDGTQFSVNAVASADRRYVIVRPSPTFSTIGDVTTFTFAGASRDLEEDGADGDADGGGDAGAGGIDPAGF